MNIITDKTKAPAKLRYRVSNNSGSINKEFGKNQQAAYYGIKEQMISMFSYRINNEYREFDQVVVYEVYPINLNDIEFV